MFNPLATARRIHGLSGLGALDLTINKSSFLVGEAPGYSVSGGAINAPLLWNSTKNGEPTGENDTDYGHKTDNVGVWTGAGGNWTTDQIGQWTKTVKVGGETDSVVFQVLPTSGQTNNTGGTVYVPISRPSTPLLNANDTIDLFGYQVPKMYAYIGGAVLAYLLFFKKR